VLPSDSKQASQAKQSKAKQGICREQYYVAVEKDVFLNKHIEVKIGIKSLSFYPNNFDVSR
jgi:hypothetical protein